MAKLAAPMLWLKSLTMAGQVALLKFREGFTIERVLNG